MTALLIAAIVLLLGQQSCSTAALIIKSCEEVCKSDDYPCSGGLCLVRLPGFSSRSVPKGLPNAPKMILKDEVEQECCGVRDDAHKGIKKLCKKYKKFNKTISGSPLQVMLGIKLKKVWLVDEAEDNFLADMRLTMSWIDPQLRLCRCRGAGMQMETLRLDALEGVKVWLPDLHIFELREDEELLSAGTSGLEMGEEASDVSLSTRGDQVAVTQDLEIITELACHMNLTYFPLERNKCKVRFGSYSYGHKRVVFKQTSLSPSSLPNTNLSLKLFPLPAKDRWVNRMVASGPQDHVYDGFYILIDQSKGAVLRYLPYAGIPLVLVVCSALGFFISGSVRRPAGIDRGPFYSVLLLGGVILYAEAISNLPHGAEKIAPPLIEAVRLSIAAIFVSFLGFFMMVKMITHLSEAKIPQGERSILVILILGFGGLGVWYFCKSYLEATVTYPCHNMIH